MLPNPSFNSGIDPDTFNPWYFPTVEDYQLQLESRGFSVSKIVLIPRPTPLPTDIRGWLSTFANPFMAVIKTSNREAFLEEVVTSLKSALCDASGQWFADYVRLRFSASKPLNEIFSSRNSFAPSS